MQSVVLTTQSCIVFQGSLAYPYYTICEPYPLREPDLREDEFSILPNDAFWFPSSDPEL